MNYFLHSLKKLSRKKRVLYLFIFIIFSVIVALLSEYNSKKGKKVVVKEMKEVKGASKIIEKNGVTLYYKEDKFQGYELDFKNPKIVYFIFDLLKNKSLYKSEEIENALKNFTENEFLDNKENYPDGEKIDFLKFKIKEKQKEIISSMLDENQWSNEIENKKVLEYVLKIREYNKTLENNNSKSQEIELDIVKWISENMKK